MLLKLHYSGQFLWILGNCAVRVGVRCLYMYLRLPLDLKHWNQRLISPFLGLTVSLMTALEISLIWKLIFASLFVVFFNNQAENSETEIILRRTAYTQEIIFQRDMSFSLLGDIVQHKYFLHQTTFCIWVAHRGSKMYGDRRNCPKQVFFFQFLYKPKNIPTSFLNSRLCSNQVLWTSVAHDM